MSHTYKFIAVSKKTTEIKYIQLDMIQIKMIENIEYYDD